MPNTNGHGPQGRAILYARVSTDEQARTGYSLAQQIEALREYAAREGYEVLEEVGPRPERGEPGAARHGPRAGPRGRRRRLRGAGPGPGPLRPRARLPLPAQARVRGARDEDPRPKRPGRRLAGGRAHGRHPRPTRQVRAGQDSGAEPARQAPQGPRGQGDQNRAANYGFKHNEAGDGYEVYEPEMLVVHRIFRSVVNGMSLYGIKRALETEGVPPPGNSDRGGGYWHASYLRKLVQDDVRPRTPTRRSSRW